MFENVFRSRLRYEYEGLGLGQGQGQGLGLGQGLKLEKVQINHTPDKFLCTRHTLPSSRFSSQFKPRRLEKDGICLSMFVGRGCDIAGGQKSPSSHDTFPAYKADSDTWCQSSLCKGKTPAELQHDTP